MSQAKYETVHSFSFKEIPRWRTCNGSTEIIRLLSFSHISSAKGKLATIPSWVIKEYFCRAVSNRLRFARATVIDPAFCSNADSSESALEFFVQIVHVCHVSCSSVRQSADVIFGHRTSSKRMPHRTVFQTRNIFASGMWLQNETIVGRHVHASPQMEPYNHLLALSFRDLRILRMASYRTFKFRSLAPVLLVLGSLVDFCSFEENLQKLPTRNYKLCRIILSSKPFFAWPKAL